VGQTLDAGLGLVLALALTAYGAGPLMALYLRQTHTAFWAAIVAPALVATVLVFADLLVCQPLCGSSLFNNLYDWLRPALGSFNLFLVFSVIWLLVTYHWARRRFLTLEV
jgi:hypothetical protein